MRDRLITAKQKTGHRFWASIPLLSLLSGGSQPNPGDEPALLPNKQAVTA